MKVKPKKACCCFGCLGIIVVLVLFFPLINVIHYGWRCFSAEAMVTAVYHNDMVSVKRIVDKYPDMVNCTSYAFPIGRPNTVLNRSIEAGHTDIALFLLDHGADPKQSGSFQCAVKKGNLRIAKALVAKGAPLKGILDYAIYHKQWKVCTLLRSLGAKDVSLAAEAAAKGDIQLLKREIRRNPSVLKTEIYDIMCRAVYCKQAGSIKTLAALGADLNTRGASGDEDPPFALACRDGSLLIIKTLVGCGAHMQWTGIETEKENGLYFAVLESHFEVVQYLLDKGLDPNVTRDALTDFLLPSEPDEELFKLKIAKLLISKGFKPDKETLRQNRREDVSQSKVESYLWKYAK